jgi:hypothetical protein
MSYGMPFYPQHPLPAKKEPEPEPDPNPPCTECPHPALDHNGDGWGVDDLGPFDWFACPDCDCRVKGYLHIKEINPLTYTTTVLPDGTPNAAYSYYAGYAGLV